MLHRRTRAPVFALAAALSLELLGCASAPRTDVPAGLDPARVRATRGQGFLVLDDGALEPATSAELFRELAASRSAIQKLLGRHLTPADFRPYEERVAGPPCAPPAGDIRVVVLDTGSRCHANENGITVVRDHLARRDATHELVHFLVGGGWRPIDEGLAVYVTERICGPAWGVAVHVRARVYLDLSLDERLDRERVQSGMSRRDYDLAGSFVKWLIETQGLDKLMDLYRRAPGDYMSVYGEGELDLEAKWLAAIRAIDVRQNGDYYRFRDLMTSLRER